VGAESVTVALREELLLLLVSRYLTLIWGYLHPDPFQLLSHSHFVRWR